MGNRILLEKFSCHGVPKLGASMWPAHDSVPSVHLWLKKSFCFIFFSVPLDTGVLKDVTVVLLATIHSAGDTFVFVANGFYSLL